MSTDAPYPDCSQDEARTFDVRELEEPPFGPIVGQLDELEAGGCLVLINSFEPEPLYDVLESRGLTYETRQVGPDEWRVTIAHE